jgi:carboxypeptidase-like protein/TonB-dependent receptor-like protein
MSYLRLNGRLAAAATLTLLPIARGNSQSILVGVVRDARSKTPLPAAEVIIEELKLHARTNTQGRYRIEDIAAGRYNVAVRLLGYDSASTLVGFSGADSTARDFDLVTHAQRLAEIPVRGKSEPLGTAKLRVFAARREKGIGHFISAEELQNQLNRQTGDILQKIPGTWILRNNSAAYVAVSRGEQSIEPNQVARICLPGKGCSKMGCAAAVFVDGAVVYRGEPDEAPFDVNTIPPSQIAGIEFYSGPSQMPPELNATRRTCGALVIWTK